ncbi:MAG: zinc ribbon domain-containing protein [Comamonadaceae bacterium]|nr:MAG: zinc ribbon domain-containing protein [Comamonadaceae bacterium]
MPTYDYACAGCGGFDAIRPVARRDEPAPCPGCGAASPRVLGAAPQLAWLDGTTRAAMATNERAQHEPRSSRDGGYGRMKHPAGCGCCSTGLRSATQRAPNGNKAFPSKRPWMISH